MHIECQPEIWFQVLIPPKKNKSAPHCVFNKSNRKNVALHTCGLICLEQLLLNWCTFITEQHCLPSHGVWWNRQKGAMLHKLDRSRQAVARERAREVKWSTTQGDVRSYPMIAISNTAHGSKLRLSGWVSCHSSHRRGWRTGCTQRVGWHRSTALPLFPIFLISRLAEAHHTHTRAAKVTH